MVDAAIAVVVDRRWNTALLCVEGASDGVGSVVDRMQCSAGTLDCSRGQRILAGAHWVRCTPHAPWDQSSR